MASRGMRSYLGDPEYNDYDSDTGGIAWPPSKTYCDLCPSRKFRDRQSLEWHLEQKTHRACDRCGNPLKPGEDYYCVSPELDGRLPRDVPQRHVKCKPVPWSTPPKPVPHSKLPPVKEPETTEPTEMHRCWVCKKEFLSEDALKHHYWETSHALCPFYVFKRQQQEREQLANRDRKRKRRDTSPPPGSWNPKDCPGSLTYFSSWFYLDSHLRCGHKDAWSQHVRRTTPRFKFRFKMPDCWKRPDLPPRDWNSRIATHNSQVRNGNTYTRTIPEDVLKTLKTLCINQDHLECAGFPFLYRDRDMKPWTVVDGFMRAPERGRHMLWPGHVMTPGKIPVPTIAPRKVVVLTTLTVRTIRSGRSVENIVHYKHGRGDAPVWVTLMDYFTGEKLVDSLIRPDYTVLDWRTKETGLTQEMMSRAMDNGDRYLDGWEAARDKVWEYIDEDTIVMGHTVCKSLWALRMVHGLVVDLRISIWRYSDYFGFWNIQSEEIHHDIERTLDTLAFDLLGLRIGVRRLISGKPEVAPRDPVEDGLAAREIMTWCMNNREIVTDWWRALKSGYIKQDIPAER